MAINAIGTDALGATTTGANNTAIGVKCITGLIQQVTQNTAVGRLSLLEANTTASNNTAVGDSALVLILQE